MRLKLPHLLFAVLSFSVALVAQSGSAGSGHGRVKYVRAYGVRNAKGEPLTTETVKYGASLTW